MRRSITSLGLVGMVLAAGTIVPAPVVAQDRLPAARAGAPDQPGRLTLKTERVVAFKDGYALIVKSATGAADGHGRVFTDDVPDAVLGCFWATSEDGSAIPMRAEWVENKTERTADASCVTMIELLRANVGKRVELTLSARSGKDEPERVSGTIREVLERPAPVEGAAVPAVQPGAQPSPSDAPEGTTITEIAPVGGQFVAIDTDHGKVVVPIAEVREVSGPDVATKFDRHERVTERHKRLTLESGQAERKVSLRILYFAPGVRWIPTYRLEGIESEQPRLSLQAEIMSELDGLGDAPIDLVAGVPNFRFKAMASPLSLERTLRNALVAAQPSGMAGMARSQFSNAVFAQRAGGWHEEDESATAAASAPPEIGGAGEQDLYVYTAGTHDLAKGSRLTLPLWSQPAPLRHIYTLNIDANQEVRPHPQEAPSQYAAPGSPEDEGYAGGAASPLKLARHRVWHQLELTNTAERPWTTGPALVLKDVLPLAQELLTYTPADGKTRLPLTVAVDVRGDTKEQESKRQSNALEWGNHNYGQVWKTATIEIRNYRKEPVTACVAAAVPGKVSQASDDGKIEIDDYRASDWEQGSWSRVNNHSDVTWEFDLKPGETKTVTYQYTYYVP